MHLRRLTTARRRAGFIALVLLPFVCGLAGPQPALAAAGFQPVASMPFGPLQSSREPLLVVDDVLQRAYMVLGADSLRVYDLRTYRPVQDIPTPVSVADGSAGRATPVVDMVHHRVFFADPSKSVCLDPARLYVLDERSLAWSNVKLPCLPNGDAIDVESMRYDAPTDSIDVFGSDGVDGVAGTFTGVRYHLAQIRVSDGSALWRVSVSPPCDFGNATNGTPDQTVALIRLPHAVAVECSTRSHNPLQGAYQNLVVTVPLGDDGHPVTDASGNPRLSYTLGVGNGLGTIADQDGGLIVFTSTLQAYGYGAYVYDASTQLFRGEVATGGGNQFASDDYPTEFGFDTSRGRLYMRNHNGLIVADVRHRPLPAGLLFPELKDTFRGTGAPPTMIAVDSLRHLLFLPDYATSTFRVYRDDTPASPDLPPPNVDQATSDIAEAPGKTAATFSGSGSGFGLLALSEGGPNRLVNGIPGLCCLIDQRVTPGDRSWFFGRVQAVSMTNEGANATSGAVELADPATNTDLSNAGVYGHPGTSDQLSGAGVGWPARSAACQDFGAGRDEHSASSAVGTARSGCDERATQAQGDASYSATTAASGVPSVAGAYESHVSTARDPLGGERTVATSTARNVNISVPGASAGIIVREISTSATTVARGRPGSAVATFSRSIHGFVSPSYWCDTDCDPQAVASAITATFRQAGIFAVATAPTPDLAWYPRGSPGGYQATVTKNTALRASESAVNDDDTDTVVGLEIVYYNDNAQGRTREILQFAGVHAESHYGIYTLSSAGSDGIAPTVDGPTVSTGVVSVAPPPASQIAAPRQAAPPKRGSRTILQAVLGGLKDVWDLVVSNPRQAAGLAFMWGLLLAPLYLGLRRRSLRGTVNAST
jgi:hypothetical protein